MKKKLNKSIKGIKDLCVKLLDTYFYLACLIFKKKLKFLLIVRKVGG